MFAVPRAKSEHRGWQGAAVSQDGGVRAVAACAMKRLSLFAWERCHMVLFASVVANRQNAMLLVKAETVRGWLRSGLRLLWKHCSKAATKQDEPRLL